MKARTIALHTSDPLQLISSRFTKNEQCVLTIQTSKTKVQLSLRTLINKPKLLACFTQEEQKIIQGYCKQEYQGYRVIAKNWDETEKAWCFELLSLNPIQIPLRLSAEQILGDTALLDQIYPADIQYLKTNLLSQ